MNEEPGQREQEGTRHDTKMCHDVELSFVWCKYGLGKVEEMGRGDSELCLVRVSGIGF